ncbi:hypothetical protein ACFWN7_08700 [Agromyces sp. NPDC058484]
MSEADEMTDAAAPAPFTMLPGDVTAPVCDGDVCAVPEAAE